MDERALVEAWVRRYTVIEAHSDRHPEARGTFWAFEQLADLCDQEPDTGWRVVLAILGSTQNDFVLQNLAAGPLETLLVKHGETIIERVEQAAATNEDFKLLLGGVYDHRIPRHISQRISRALQLSAADDLWNSEP